jgi:hypothetical protein
MNDVDVASPAGGGFVRLLLQRRYLHGKLGEMERLRILIKE